jgi:hypothetical protein
MIGQGPGSFLTKIKGRLPLVVSTSTLLAVADGAIEAS